LKKLNDILTHVELSGISGNVNLTVNDIVFDSRKATQGSLFVAVRGTRTDGNHFIPDVIKAGCQCILCEKLPVETDNNVTYLITPDTSMALGIISSNFYNCPSQKLKLIGVTGTNGKTTIATLLFKLFTKLGFKTGLMSTVQNIVTGQPEAATHTTADAVSINQALYRMVEYGCNYCFMEVSSHAADQKRISGLNFAGAVFTNLTHDHLDYHSDFHSYLKAKKSFFDKLPAGAFALINTDDRNGKIMVQNTRATIKTYALKQIADFKGLIKGNTIEGLHMLIGHKEVWFKLTGGFNAYNLLAVYGTAMLLGFESEAVLEIMSSLTGAEGRFEIIKNQNGVTGVVDYAHTPDALKNVLATINQLITRNQQIITVVGAGGDRDRSKRPLMGQIAASLSNKVILTSDNPRTEAADTIIQEMSMGINENDKFKVIEITNRKEAIKTACMLAGSGDIVLVAGKGHEKYQEIGGIRYPFDDLKVLNDFLNR